MNPIDPATPTHPAPSMRGPLALVLLLAVGATAATNGPIPYFYLQYNATPMSVFSALSSCPNTWLVTPYSQGIHESLTDNLMTPVSLGMFQSGTQWLWITGSRAQRAFFGSGVVSSDFTAWEPNEPSTGICARYDPPPLDGWASMDCTTPLAFVCQVPIQTQLTFILSNVQGQVFATTIVPQLCAAVGGWAPTFVTLGHNAALRSSVQGLTGLMQLGGDNFNSTPQMRWTAGPLANEAGGSGRRFYIDGVGFTGAQEYTRLESPPTPLAAGTCAFLRLPSLNLVFAPCATGINDISEIVCESILDVSGPSQPTLTYYARATAMRTLSDAASDCLAQGGALPVEVSELTYEALANQHAETWLNGQRNTTDNVWRWNPPDAMPVAFYDMGACIPPFICHWDPMADTVDPNKTCMSHSDSVWFERDCASTRSYACRITANTTLSIFTAAGLTGVASASTVCSNALPGSWPATLQSFEHMQRLRELSTTPYTLYLLGGMDTTQQNWVSGPLSLLSGQTPFHGTVAMVERCLGEQGPCSFDPSFTSGNCVAVQATTWRFLRVECSDNFIAGVVCESFGSVTDPVTTRAPITTASRTTTQSPPAAATTAGGLSGGALAAAIVVPIIVILAVLIALVVVFLLRRGSAIGGYARDSESDDEANYVLEPLPNTPYSDIVRGVPVAPNALNTGGTPSARVGNEQLRFSIPSGVNPSDFKKPLTRKDGRKYKSQYVSPPARLSDAVLERWGLPPLPPEDPEEVKKREDARRRANKRRLQKLKEQREEAEREKRRKERRKERLLNGESDDDEEEEEEEAPAKPSTTPVTTDANPTATSAPEDEELSDMLATSFPGLAAVDEGEQVED